MHTTQTLDHAQPSGRLAPRQIARSKLLILLAAVISFLLSVFLWFNGHVRHEAPLIPSGDERAPPLGCRSSLAKLRAA
jgi:hypothetical protein